MAKESAIGNVESYGTVNVFGLLDCGKGCFRDTVILVSIGGKFIAECISCQNSTPMLPKDEAIKYWNENCGKKVS